MNKVNQFKAICKTMSETYEKKNHDYGDSFGKTFEELGIISAVTRMSDKMNRVKSLAVKGSSKVESEAMEDTLLDLACYSVMTLIELLDENSTN